MVGRKYRLGAYQIALASEQAQDVPAGRAALSAGSPGQPAVEICSPTCW